MRRWPLARLFSKSLSSRAALYVALICAAILALEGSREWSAREAVIAHARVEYRNLANAIRQHVEDSYELAEASVVRMVEMLQADSMAIPRLQGLQFERMSGFFGSERSSAAFVYGADGNLLVAPYGANAPAAEDSAEIVAALSQSASPHSRYDTVALTGTAQRWAISVSRRVSAPDGSFAGAVIATVDSTFLASSFSNFEVGEHGSISLLTREGRLLARYPALVDQVGSDLGRRPLFADPELRDRSSGAYSYVSTLDGIERIGGFDRSARYPIVAVAAASLDDTLIHWRASATQRALLTLLLVSGVAVLGYRLAEQIRRRHRSEEVLRRKEEEFRLLAESASDIVERFDAEGQRLYVSPAVRRVLGYLPRELEGKSAYDAIAAPDRAAVDAAVARLRAGQSEEETITYRAMHRDGYQLWLETSLRVAADGAARSGVVGVTRDITARKELELRLAQMAALDGLTGLANRRAFDDGLRQAVAQLERSGQPLSLLIIDVDRFKRYNDDYGHVAGDACLKAIAAVVAGAARDGDLAARYGGEEMCLMLPNTDLGAARRIAAEICRRVQDLSMRHERNLPWKVASVSIGVATIGGSSEETIREASWLIRSANLALYEAKAQGRNQFSVAPLGLIQRTA